MESSELERHLPYHVQHKRKESRAMCDILPPRILCQMKVSLESRNPDYSKTQKAIKALEDLKKHQHKAS